MANINKKKISKHFFSQFKWQPLQSLKIKIVGYKSETHAKHNSKVFAVNVFFKYFTLQYQHDANCVSSKEINLENATGYSDSIKTYQIKIETAFSKSK